MKRNFIRNRYLFLLDLAMCFLAYISVIVIVFPIASFGEFFLNSFNIILLSAISYVVSMTIFHIYRTDWVYAASGDYVRLIISCLPATVFSIVTGLLISGGSFYLKINLATNFGIAFLLCGLRFFVKFFYKYLVTVTKSVSKRVLIIGAGHLAIILMRDIYENKDMKYEIVGLIDDNIQKQKSHIYGTKVIGTREDIIRTCKEKQVDEIIFAIHEISSEQKAEILNICSQTGRKVKILPSFADSLSGSYLNQVREVEIEDLLERDPIKLDNELIQKDICGKVVLVTGGGGSIGSELCRQIIKYKPERLIILDIYENTTYELQNELSENYPDQKLDVLIASVRDKKRLNTIFETYKPEIVFHAAAHKHVPLMEYSPGEAIKNNVFGTYNTATCAKEYGVRRFVLISTDKAVNPTNVMGASKRMCEMIVQTLQKNSETDFVAVRFGNVLGSNGSVIPRFEKQIAQGGPITVTHPEITRFFMTIPEAAQLVLQAASYAKGGEIFVLDMGHPVKIYDLARKMITLSGLIPDLDIKIEFTGLRPGEKLYEELLMNEEGLKTTAHSKIFVGQPIDLELDELNQKLETLQSVSYDDEAEVKRVMQEVVPTYVHTPNN